MEEILNRVFDTLPPWALVIIGLGALIGRYGPRAISVYIKTNREVIEGSRELNRMRITELELENERLREKIKEIEQKKSD